MRFDEFIIRFKEQVYAAPFGRQVDLALYVCKRLFPEYATFLAEGGPGHLDPIVDGVRLAERARGGTYDRSEVEELLRDVEAVIPDTDEWGDATGAQAMHAAASVAELLEFLLDRDPEHIYNIGTYLTDSVECALREEVGDDADLDKHPGLDSVHRLLLGLDPME